MTEVWPTASSCLAGRQPLHELGDHLPRGIATPADLPSQGTSCCRQGAAAGRGPSASAAGDDMGKWGEAPHQHCEEVGDDQIVGNQLLVLLEHEARD